jgi:N-acetylmuramoyl-L-alanine amidase
MPGAPPPTPTQPSTPPQAVTPPPRIGPTIVLDPAHGGSDPGARGAMGIVEKDLTLNLARVVRGELERQGYRVFMTRNDDSNPSYDDRAAVANAHRDSVFITIHIASTGAFGSARTYIDQFAEPLPTAQPTSTAATNVLAWDDAQRSYLDASHRFGDILQAQMAQRFMGSPTTATAAPVRELRSVAAPAVAVEISSVVTKDPGVLAQRAGPLAAAIAGSAHVYRPSAGSGAGSGGADSSAAPGAR